MHGEFSGNEFRGDDSSFVFPSRVSSGGSYIPWEQITKGKEEAIAQLCRNADIAFLTGQPLRHVRALQRHAPRHFTLLTAIAYAPDQIVDSESAPILQTDPVLTLKLDDYSLVCSFVPSPLISNALSASRLGRDADRSWARWLRRHNALVRFAVMAAIIFTVTYLVKGNGQ